MSEWKEFLRRNDELTALVEHERPGPVLVNFVNRYLEPLDCLMYRIEYEGKVLRGVTNPQTHAVDVHPLTSKPINVLVWSKRRGEFKAIAQLRPRLNQRLLASLRLKTFRHQSKTERHPTSQAEKTSAKPSMPPAESAETWDVAEQGVEFAKSKNKLDEPEHKVRRPRADKILAEQLKKIFPAADEKYLITVADELNTDLEKYKLDTPLRRAHFFAQVRQEAGPSLSPKQECLNYLPQVLIDKFSYYRKNPDEADVDGRLEETSQVEKQAGKIRKMVFIKRVIRPADQRRIANKAYANRDGNGSIESEHGWKYRGRGIFQLTLRANYKKFTKEYSNIWTSGEIDFLAEPDNVCEFPYFIRSAVWFWISKSVYTLADNGTDDSNIDLITERVNGDGKDAAEKRRRNFHELCYPVFK